MEIRYVGVDLDDTSVNTLEKVLPIFNGVFGKNFTREDMKEYDYDMYYGPSVWNVYTQNVEDIHVNTPPLDGCHEVICRLIESGISVDFITARNADLNHYAKRWLEKNGFPENIVVWHTKEKGKMCEALNIDVMIDDSPEKALDVAEHGIKVLLMDMPYNRDISHENIVRVHNWKEIEEWIEANRG